MRQAHVIQIQTPKNVRLNGLWFGNIKAKRTVVFVHGLTSSAFSMGHVVDEILSKDVSVITFNNRGFEKITDVKRGEGKKAKWIEAGSAHEVFTDCVDDLQGAINYAKAHGAKNIFLAGHSTGCQKSIYWAHKAGKDVKGIILLAPISDYSSALKNDKEYKKGLAYAQKLIKAGKPHALLPKEVSGEFLADAQRFISLYTPESVEEIFCYAQPNKDPRVLRSIKIPVLVLLAEHDEYADRTAFEIGEWFDGYFSATHNVAVVAEVGHSFKGGEKQVAQAAKTFMDDK